MENSGDTLAWRSVNAAGVATIGIFGAEIRILNTLARLTDRHSKVSADIGVKILDGMPYWSPLWLVAGPTLMAGLT